MPGEPTIESRRERRFRPSAVVAFSSLLVLGSAVALGFFAGRSFQPVTDPVVGVTERTPVTYPVERRRLADTVTIPGRVVATEIIDIRYSGDAARRILTGLPVSEGDTIADGTVLMEVDGTPVVAFVGTTVPYRDLERGMEGRDVAGLQEALVRLGYLRAEPNGRFGRATERAVQAMLTDRGYSGKRLAYGHYVFLPADTTVLRVNAAPGDILGDDPVLAVGTDSVGILVPFTASQRESWTVESTAAIAQNGVELVFDRFVDIDDGLAARFSVAQRPGPPGSEVMVDIVFEQTAGEVPTVPVTALTLEPDGTVAVRKLDSSGTATAVPVSPGLEVNGWVEIGELEGVLEVGDMVVLGGTGP